ncbi:phosphatase [Aquincola sp. MAHUQ-54]|uniref:Phosphatase n=1 Tax=Aquincola agrisoli TaxID=3119538 RepID=A0AAW9QL92_9BURK
MTLFWNTVTRLGEAQLLLPALLAATAWLALRARAPRVALTWLGATGVAAAITTVTKIAFIGWGIGYAPLDFTGISGHAMFAAAILPLLAREAVGAAHPRWHGPAVGIGLALAALVAVSRVEVYAHSPSESWAGFLLGAGASVAALSLVHMPRTSAPKKLILLLGAWLLVAVPGAPASRTHDWVTAISIGLAGRDAPYTRQMMHRDWQLQRNGAQRYGAAR